jgi:hypothetical protein
VADVNIHLRVPHSAFRSVDSQIIETSAGDVTSEDIKKSHSPSGWTLDRGFLQNLIIRPRRLLCFETVSAYPILGTHVPSKIQTTGAMNSIGDGPSKASSTTIYDDGEAKNGGVRDL